MNTSELIWRQQLLLGCMRKVLFLMCSSVDRHSLATGQGDTATSATRCNHIGLWTVDDGDREQEVMGANQFQPSSNHRVSDRSYQVHTNRPMIGLKSTLNASVFDSF